MQFKTPARIKPALPKHIPMSLREGLSVMAGLLLITACAASSPEASDDQAVSEPVTGERLIAAPPSDWELVYQTNNPTTRITDFVPQGETKAVWETKLSFQSFTTENLALDPVTLLLTVTEEDKDRCDEVKDFNIFSGYENNYETSVRLFLCSENAFTRKGEIKLIKSIRGNDHIYLIRLARRIEPFELNSLDRESSIATEEVAAWSTYLKQITVCDDTDSHPCP